MVGGWLDQVGIRLSQLSTKLKLKLKLSFAIAKRDTGSLLFQGWVYFLSEIILLNGNIISALMHTCSIDTFCFFGIQIQVEMAAIDLYPAEQMFG